jgi:DNA-binding response OmpR family regulator
MPKILVVEDEVDLCNLIKSHLEADGHTVAQAFDGPSALTLVESQNPDLIVLDWMLPGMDGLAICRRVRARHLMPILMLTARAEEIDRVLGLEVGADDYVVKPFSIRELMARVRAMLRRVALDARGGSAAAPSGPSTSADDPRDLIPPPPQPIVRGQLRIDPASRTASIGGAEVDLTPKEFDLLQLLASHPARAFSREFLVEHLWGYEYDGVDRTVDTHIVRLRKKLGAIGDQIVTVWGVGYRFVEA